MKQLFFTFVLLITICVSPVVGAIRCIPYHHPDTQNFCRPTGSFTGKVEWTVYCSTFGNVYGISACVNVYPKSVRAGCYNAGTTFLGYTDTVSGENATACWCKIISPFVSPWVCSGKSFGVIGNPNGEINCATNCAQACAEAFASNTSLNQDCQYEFYDKMFGSRQGYGCMDGSNCLLLD